MPWTDRRHLLAISGGDKHSVPHVDTRGRFRGYLQAFFSLVPRQLEGHAKIHAGNEVRGGEGVGEAGRRLGLSYTRGGQGPNSLVTTNPPNMPVTVSGIEYTKLILFA